MTHPKKDIELVEVLQASYEQGDDPLRALLAHTIQRVLEEEITAFLILSLRIETTFLHINIYLAER